MEYRNIPASSKKTQLFSRWLILQVTCVFIVPIKCTPNAIWTISIWHFNEKYSSLFCSTASGTASLVTNTRSQTLDALKLKMKLSCYLCWYTRFVLNICSKYASGKNCCLYISLEVRIDWSFSFAFLCCARMKFQPLLDGFSHSCNHLATHLSVVAAAVGVL